MNEIFIYDDIGPDWAGMVSAKFVIDELKKFAGEPVTIRINSPGGFVSEGQAIYNALRRHSQQGGKVTTAVDALAASIASYIAMAGDEIEMAENAMLMIHKAWTWMAGNADDFRKEAGVLDKFDDTLADTYVARSKQDKEKVLQMLADETWLTAKEAVELGFADTIGTPLNIAANVKPGRFAKMPETFPTVETIEREKARRTREAIARNTLQVARARAGV